MPASLSSRIVASRRAGVDARGSIFLASSGSSVAMEMYTATASNRASSRKHIEIRGDRMVLRHDADRVAKIGADLEALSRQPQFSLDRLIAIGHPAERDDLRLPAPRGQRLAQQLGRVALHHDPALEIEARAETKIFVGRSRVAVDAAVFASAIRIQRILEADIRAVVPAEDRLAAVVEEHRPRPGFFVVRERRLGVRVDRILQPCKAVRGIADRATPERAVGIRRRRHGERSAVPAARASR